MCEPTPSAIPPEAPTQCSFQMNLPVDNSLHSDVSLLHTDSVSNSSLPSLSHSTTSFIDFSSVESASELSDDSDSAVSTEETQCTLSQPTTYKLVGDNIDKNVRPRE